MADNKNIIIGLLVVAVIILLAFLTFRPMMYGSTYASAQPQVANNQLRTDGTRQ